MCLPLTIDIQDIRLINLQWANHVQHNHKSLARVWKEIERRRWNKYSAIPAQKEPVHAKLLLTSWANIEASSSLEHREREPKRAQHSYSQAAPQWCEWRRSESSQLSPHNKNLWWLFLVRTVAAVSLIRFETLCDSDVFFSPLLIFLVCALLPATLAELGRLFSSEVSSWINFEISEKKFVRLKVLQRIESAIIINENHKKWKKKVFAVKK